MKVLTTGSATSASSSARRTSRRVSAMLSSVRRPRPRSELAALESRSVRLENMRWIIGQRSRAITAQHGGHGLLDASDGNELHALGCNARLVVFRHQRTGEPLLRGLAQAFFAVGHGPHFAGEAE